jgi:hypothetical protein
MVNFNFIVFHRALTNLAHQNVQTTMIYTHVINKGGKGVRSPLDMLG